MATEAIIHAKNVVKTLGERCKICEKQIEKLNATVKSDEKIYRIIAISTIGNSCGWDYYVRKNNKDMKRAENNYTSNISAIKKYYQGLMIGCGIQDKELIMRLMFINNKYYEDLKNLDRLWIDYYNSTLKLYKNKFFEKDILKMHYKSNIFRNMSCVDINKKYISLINNIINSYKE